MASIDLNELSPKYPDRRARRLRRLKNSVAANEYEVSSRLIALGMIREAFSDAASRRVMR